MKFGDTPFSPRLSLDVSVFGGSSELDKHLSGAPFHVLLTRDIQLRFIFRLKSRTQTGIDKRGSASGDKDVMLHRDH